MSAGVERRQVALHVDDDPGAAAAGRRLPAPRRCGRSRRRDRRASSPRARRPVATAAAISARIGRHHDRPDRGLLRPRRITCTIIGAPPMSASGLPGSRVEAMRAGIRIRTSDVMEIAGSPAGSAHGKSQAGAPLIRVARRRQTGYLSPPPGAAPAPIPAQFPPPGARAAMDSFELNKILGALLGTCLFLLVAQHRRRRDLRARTSRPSPATRSRSPRSAAGGGAAKPASRTSRSRQLLAKRRRREGRERRQEVRRLPYLRQGRARTASARTSTASSAAEGAPRPGFNYSAAHEGARAATGRRRPQRIPRQPARAIVPGTNMTFAGLPRGSERADVIAYLNSHVGQSGAAAEGRRGRRRSRPEAAGKRLKPAASRDRGFGAGMRRATIRAARRCREITTP